MTQRDALPLGGTASGNEFQYIGRENDFNGLYYLHARYYSPAMGRFISEDPLAALATRVASWSDEWIKENRFWNTSLAENVGGRLDFLNDFSGAPSCIAAPGLLLLRFECPPAASKWWKDWLVLRFLKDLETAFNEIAVESIGNCLDPPVKG